MFQPKKLCCRIALCFHGLTTASGTQKSSQDDLNGDIASRIPRKTIVHGMSSLSVNGPFSSWRTHLTCQGLSTAALTPSHSGRRLTLYFIQCHLRLFLHSSDNLNCYLPGKLRLFKSSQPLPSHQSLTAGMFHRFLVSLARQSRKCGI